MTKLTYNDYLVILSPMILSAVFCGLFIVRSICLKKPINPDSIKLYAFFFIAGIIGSLGFAKILEGQALVALIGGLVGFTVGTKGLKIDDDK